MQMQPLEPFTEIFELENRIRGSRVGEISTQEAANCEAIEFAFLKSGYPLQNVRCDCHSSSIRLIGRVDRYFHLQVSIEIARRFSKGRQIVNEIIVTCAQQERYHDSPVER